MQHPRRRNRLSLSLVFALSFFLAGCGGAIQLRQAQDLYNHGVQIENELLLMNRLERLEIPDPRVSQAQPPAFDSLPYESPKEFYRASLETLAKLDDNKLKSDGLLASKRMLEALCNWRLGSHEQAREAADRALGELGDDSLPRDSVIATALIGFIKIQEARQLIGEAKPGNADQRTEAFSRIRPMLFEHAESASSLLKAARLKAGDSAMRIFLIWYELDAMDTLYAARDELLHEDDLQTSEKKRVNELLEEMKEAGHPQAVKISDNLRAYLPNEVEAQ